MSVALDQKPGANATHRQLDAESHAERHRRRRHKAHADEVRRPVSRGTEARDYIRLDDGVTPT